MNSGTCQGTPYSTLLELYDALLKLNIYKETLRTYSALEGQSLQILYVYLYLFSSFILMQYFFLQGFGRFLFCKIKTK